MRRREPGGAGGPKRILVLGGGFAGVYAAMELERAFGRDPRVQLTLVNRDNFFLFTPMLHEVAASDLDMTHIVSPIRKLLRRTDFFHGECLSIDLAARTVKVAHGESAEHPHELPYDHLVLALGGVTNFFGTPGAERAAFTMRSLGDALALRNRVIESMEEADFECQARIRKPLLTFVVAGGGFAGVETVAALHDFLVEALPFYRNLRPDQIRTVLVHSGDVILPELSRKLGLYAQRKLAGRGVEIRVGTKVKGLDATGIDLSDGTRIPSRTLVWTAGNAAHPLLQALECPKERGRICVDSHLRVPGHDGLWAVGDCALVPDPKGGFCPQTAQHALRQGRVLARNVVAAVRGGKPRAFRFRTLGQLAAIGRRTGVASILGLNFSGFLAWWLWRTIYLMKLPRFERKVRVALDWTLDLIFTKDLVHLPTSRAKAVPLAAPALAAAERR
ncbi:MAG: NAD(P)/FAD-dependent oxidoreductase [Planctomycetes bacterium]|nr:NAD(P)/FAD-dependent oxidoreductase [Planctomycetota bacterium]